MDQPHRGGRGKKNGGSGTQSGSSSPRTTSSAGSTPPQRAADTSLEQTSASVQQLSLQPAPGDMSVPAGLQEPALLIQEAGDATPFPTDAPESSEAAESPSTPHVLTEKKFFPPPRPNFGKLGRTIPLLVNFFPIKIDCGMIAQYDVKVFTEEMVAKKGYEGNGMQDREEKRYVMESFLKDCDALFPGECPVYDGRAIMYTKKPLKERPYHVVEYSDPEDGKNGERRKAHVVLKFATRVDLSLLNHFVNRKENYKTGIEREAEIDLLQVAITAIDIILKELPKAHAIPLGRNFYFYPKDLNQQNDLRGGRWIWDGFFQSVRPGQWKPFINIDKTSGAFVKPMPLLDFIFDLTDTDAPIKALDKRNRQRIADHISNLLIQATHMKYKKRQRIISRPNLVFLESARDEMFEKDGKKMSVEQYFLQQYNCKLRYPMIPCIDVGKPPTKFAKRKKTALPIELCLIKDAQRSGVELESDQTTTMLKMAAKPAFERKMMISEVARHVLGETDKFRKHYQISTEPNMLRVDGRVLQPPKILYKDNQADPRGGQWDITHYQLLQAKSMSHWVLLDLVRTDPRSIDKFVGELQRQSLAKGMKIELPAEIVKREPRTDKEIRKILIDLKAHFGNLELILIIMDERMPPRKFSFVVYREVKKVGDTEIGVPTQCVKKFNVDKANGSTVGNICLKINAKLGGVNHTVLMEGTPTAELLKVPTMFVGADVNHPGPGTDKYTPSIAAAVATLDRRLAKYSSACRFQQHERAEVDTSTGAKKRFRKEIIVEFKDMMIELLRAFMKFNKERKPQRIIYYRDGVSESQFMAVLEHELLALRAACTEIDPEYKPTMTIIIVQKRHHLRMFPGDPRDETGKAKNIPPGTVLDHTITHQVEFNFYLNSHYALQGTSKCSLYHVLWDENDFTADKLQAVTYQLCHTYARCAKSVSYPTPVYYSHWVAFRYCRSAGYSEPDRDRNALTPTDGNWNQFKRDVKTELGTMYWA